MMAAADVLVADDQEDVLVALRILLKQENIRATIAKSPAEVLALVRKTEFDAALIDLNYAHASVDGGEGLALLAELRRLAPDLPVVVMTAWGTVQNAVTAMQEGARDFIEKPWDNQRLLRTLQNQIALTRALREAARLRQENLRLKTARFAPPLVGSSRAMQPMLRLLERLAPSEATVLITGEHGTGKEIVARHLHAASPRAAGPFIAVNSGAFSEGVFESEFFGHVKGAFTDAKAERRGALEAAHKGSLFLDEIGTMPLTQQAKLLRALQTREISRVGSSQSRPVDIRVIAATNLDLVAEVKAGRFREDLLYRLNTVEIKLPPLRERENDVLELAAYFLAQATERTGIEYRFHPDAVQRIREHTWPGNVRELSHAVERGVLLADGSELRAADLCLPTSRSSEVHRPETTLDESERFLIQEALERASGNISHAAAQLGISRSALYRRLQRHGLALPQR